LGTLSAISVKGSEASMTIGKCINILFSGQGRHRVRIISQRNPAGILIGIKHGGGLTRLPAGARLIERKATCGPK
jgi:hypothetical protein